MKGFPSKVLIISDYPHPHFAERISVLPDFILSLGDVEFKILSEIHEIYNKPIFAVKGNHDTTQPFPAFVKNVHFRMEQYRNWFIGGWEGVPIYKAPTRYQWDDLNAMEKLNKFPHVDIFICHAPLAGITDKEDSAHQGSEAILRYVEEKQPKYVFHGHVHSRMGAMIGSTAVVSVYGVQMATVD